MTGLSEVGPPVVTSLGASLNGSFGMGNGLIKPWTWPARPKIAKSKAHKGTAAVVKWSNGGKWNPNWISGFSFVIFPWIWTRCLLYPQNWPNLWRFPRAGPPSILTHYKDRLTTDLDELLKKMERNPKFTSLLGRVAVRLIWEANGDG